MSSIFSRSNEQTQTPNRNVFDLSFRNNLTLKAGQITPCFLREVMPGDSVKIDASFGFNFQPMIFPVQSDMNCSLHFFYVRNRALWRGWESFITKTEDPNNDTIPPYIQLTNENRHMFETGQIGDYLGVPTVYYGPSNGMVNMPLTTLSPFNYRNGNWRQELGIFTEAISLPSYDSGDFDGINSANMPFYENIAKSYRVVDTPYYYDGTPQFYAYKGEAPFATRSFSMPISSSALHLTGSWSGLSFLGSNNGFQIYVMDDTGSMIAFQFYRQVGSNNFLLSTYTTYDDTDELGRKSGFDLSDSTFVRNTLRTETAYPISQRIVLPADFADHRYTVYVVPLNQMPTTSDIGVQQVAIHTSWYIDESFGVDNSIRELSELPFVSSSNPDGLRISAMPFRAVEACYNSFYRDERNNPLRIDGKEYYNIWVQNRNGGADTGVYELYNRNWLEDQFTTAVQSPQQGVLPLVGVTATGNMEFQDEEGKSYYLQADFAEDGHTITGISSYSSDMPVGTLHAMVDTISTGISINDFRNVNAFQRWLETNMRKGLRYKDQIEAHFGTSPTYSELQMPEFIGGMSRKVNISPITQTTGTLGQPDGTPLGTMAGQANVFGDAGAPVTHYCDEHGWIIGFVCITPEPVYSQALHKQLLKRDTLDYYFPEFAHIGFQPILNQEIAPLQTNPAGVNNDKPTDVFGYQRAWYDYIASFDEVHGDYRTTMRNYLIQRIFDGVPQLGVEFLTVGDAEVNEVFAVRDSDVSKIFGQIAFKCTMKRPIPKYGIPRLEVG